MAKDDEKDITGTTIYLEEKREEGVLSTIVNTYEKTAAAGVNGDSKSTEICEMESLDLFESLPLYIFSLSVSLFMLFYASLCLFFPIGL